MALGIIGVYRRHRYGDLQGLVDLQARGLVVLPHMRTSYAARLHDPVVTPELADAYHKGCGLRLEARLADKIHTYLPRPDGLYEWRVKPVLPQTVDYLSFLKNLRP